MEEYKATFYLIRASTESPELGGQKKFRYYGVDSHPVFPADDSMWWSIKEYGYLSESGARRGAKHMKQWHYQCRDATLQVIRHTIVFPNYDEYIRQCGSRLKSARARKDKT